MSSVWIETRQGQQVMGVKEKEGCPPNTFLDQLAFTVYKFSLNRSYTSLYSIYPYSQQSYGFYITITFDSGWEIKGNKYTYTTGLILLCNLTTLCDD